MSIILSEIKCKACGEPQVQDPKCGGDYHLTVNGYVLQRYCRGDCDKNGIMYPELEKKEIEYLSNRQQKNIFFKCCVKHNLRIKDYNSKVKLINDNTFKGYTFKLAQGLDLSVDQVMRCCM